MNTASASRQLSTPDMWREILRMKKEMNAVILAHYYQDSEIQDLADFRGDSYELSRRAAETDADVIVFAGVHFMAETAKILNPGKQVLLPDLNAGCSLAESAPAHLFRRFRQQNPEHLAVTYINCSAEVKTLSDIIITSSSAERIIGRIPERYPILFSPDKNLGQYIMRKTGRDMLLWQGACTVHESFSEKKILALRREHPGAEIIAHPECEGSVLRHADFIGSTSALLARVQESSVAAFIIATEVGILHEMKRLAPDKELIAAPPDADCACNKCDYMKLNTTEKLYLCMKNRRPELGLGEETLRGALRPIRRMLALGTPEASTEDVFADIRLPFS